MLYKTIFKIFVCILLLTITSCSVEQSTGSKAVAEQTIAVQSTTEQTITSEAQAETEAEFDTEAQAEPAGKTSEVLISLGDKKLTMEQVKWAVPAAGNEKTVKFADWWVENELLNEEAERRGLTNQPKVIFLSEMAKNRKLSSLLIDELKKVSDEEILAYYEENRETDKDLQQQGRLVFSHIKTKSLQDAQAVLRRVKGGEEINELAKILSIANDAKSGGKIWGIPYSSVQKSFGKNFFDALVGSEAGKLIGPVKSKGGYEIALLEDKTEPGPVPFEKAKSVLRSRLERQKLQETLKKTLEQLKEDAADRIFEYPLLSILKKTTKGQGEPNPPQKVVEPN
ncbi:peptidyl-prolyl cis-trans isomerase [Planctomycetota bacterium]